MADVRLISFVHRSGCELPALGRDERLLRLLYAICWAGRDVADLGGWGRRRAEDTRSGRGEVGDESVL